MRRLPGAVETTRSVAGPGHQRLSSPSVRSSGLRRTLMMSFLFKWRRIVQMREREQRSELPPLSRSSIV